MSTEVLGGVVGELALDKLLFSLGMPLIGVVALFMGIFGESAADFKHSEYKFTEDYIVVERPLWFNANYLIADCDVK